MFFYHVENLAVVSSRGSGYLSRDPVQLCLVIVCPTKSEGKQRPKFLICILLLLLSIAISKSFEKLIYSF